VDVTSGDILAIYRIVLERIDPLAVGRLPNTDVRMAGSSTILPSPAKVPSAMSRMIDWPPAPPEHPATVAADAHFKRYTIHPFVNGNDCQGRLLMNLLVMHTGYPPAIIVNENRLSYISAIERAENDGQRTTARLMMTTE